MSGHQTVETLIGHELEGGTTKARRLFGRAVPYDVETHWDSAGR